MVQDSAPFWSCMGASRRNVRGLVSSRLSGLLGNLLDAIRQRDAQAMEPSMSLPSAGVKWLGFSVHFQFEVKCMETQEILSKLRRILDTIHSGGNIYYDKDRMKAYCIIALLASNMRTKSIRG